MSDNVRKNDRQKSRDEVISTFAKYGLFNGEGILHFGESEEIHRLVWFFSNGRIESFELPDAYVKVDDQILIIEHFAIDGFETYPDGGSKLQRHEAITEREFRDMPATETGVHMSTQIGVSNSYAGFIKNCQAKFDHHYSRISCYKKHLLDDGIASENTRFTVCFLLDEVSPMGTLTHDGEKLQPVCLAYSKEFLEYFISKPDVAVYRQAVLKEAFESVISESDTCNVEDVCKDIKVGIVIKPAQYYTSADVGVRAFRSANVREFAINDSDWAFLTRAGHEANLRSEIHTGDVLVVRSGYPGTACVVPPAYDGCNAIDILIAVPDMGRILPEYLCAYTNSPLGRKIVQEKKRGVAQAHFNVSGYSKTPIIVPSLDTQRRVVTEIDSRLSVCDSIEQTVDAALQQAEAMRQSILKDAFEGRL